MPKQDILAALEQLLAWQEIARSPQLAQFLDYIVRRTLGGQQQSIKAYSIAVDVLGRGSDFDPQSDPIVRVQARRLRGLLDQYYRGPGANAAIQILLPVGRYIPEFVGKPATEQVPELLPEPQEFQTPKPIGRFPLASWLSLGLIAVVTACVAVATSNWGGGDVLARPTLAISEFADLTGDSVRGMHVAGLAIELVTDIGQFDEIDISYGTGRGGAGHSDFALSGIVRQDGDTVQYTAMLTAAGGNVVWNQTLAVPLADALSASVVDRVSQAFSLVLGSPRGPIHADLRSKLLTRPTLGTSSPYLCRMLFNLYRETSRSDDAVRADACLAQLHASDPQTPSVLAALASLVSEQGHTVAQSDEITDPTDLAADWLFDAISLNPTSSFIWEQQARFHEGQGNGTLAQADFASAVQLNPANIDALAEYARLLALSGQWDEAEEMSSAAMTGGGEAPAWYLAAPTLLALHKGNFVDAATFAERYTTSDRELGPVLAVMAGEGAGDSAVINRYLPQVIETAGFRAVGVLPHLRQRVVDVDLIAAIGATLSRAGVPAAALEGPF